MFYVVYQCVFYDTIRKENSFVQSYVVPFLLLGASLFQKLSMYKTLNTPTREEFLLNT